MRAPGRHPARGCLLRSAGSTRPCLSSHCDLGAKASAATGQRVSQNTVGMDAVCPIVGDPSTTSVWSFAVSPLKQPPDIPRIVEVFERIPHCRALGMKVVELRYGQGFMTVPYDPALVGNPTTGVVHGGVITALLDTLCGLVVMASIPQRTALATLDLRIDYLHPATPHVAIMGSAECYKVTDSIAFVRGLAYQETFRDPVATCAGTFMLGATGFTAEAAQVRAEPAGEGMGP
ncbi:MAG: PaaI family thioesterase [Rhodospirillales bacterium]|nr:MAG: PaaI family thioesterase [Rhodospirillales bacterium]